ncbi:MAG: AAA family ATPase [Bacteroidota bacterium]|jgi:protein RecA
MSKERVKVAGHSLDGVINALRKQLDVPLFMPSSRRIVPMRHKSLGVLLGGEQSPGLPSGYWIEIVGNAASGKTTLAFTLAEAVMSQPADATFVSPSAEGMKTTPVPRKVLYLDFEHTLDMTYLKACAPSAVVAVADTNGKIANIDSANLFVHSPATLEEGVDIAVALCDTGEFGLVVVDSIPAMLSAAEQDLSMASNTVGLLPRQLNKMFRRMTGSMARNGCTTILINQWRDKIGVAFGDPRTTPGGKATEYFDAIKLDVSGSHKPGYFSAGKICNIRCMKNKVTGLRGNVATYELGHGVGISAEVELFDRAVEAGVIKNGRTCTIAAPGREAVNLGSAIKVIERLRSDKKFRDAMERTVASNEAKGIKSQQQVKGRVMLAGMDD